jgi:FMN-dependent oxidoreductase (nitrilotriacetate monooxygenase family)
MFHLGWFVGGVPFNSWRSPWADIRPSDGIRPDLYVDLARALERAGFDYLMFEDSMQIDDQYKGSIDACLKYGIECPASDPLAMIAIVSQATRHIGLISTLSTSFYPPFLAARTLATLDHLSDGRVGGNLVTSSSHRAAQNFGLDRQMDHDRRYEKAGEWVQVVKGLLNSWEPGAVVLDKATNTMIDPTKVHAIDFEGEFFKCRGPLNMPPGPQGQVVFCQAGGSAAGRAFAARNVDTIVCVPLGIEAMKQYRDDISAQMIAAGRKPTDCKVIYLVRPIIAETDTAARELYEADKAYRASEAFLEPVLANMSYFAQIDFSQFDPDEPIPDLRGKVNGHQSTTDRYFKDSVINKKTLKQVALTQDYVASIELVGSPDSVADMMGEAMDYVGGDGFFLSMFPLDRRTVATITEGLVPALRKRRLVRSHYEHKYFKDNLLAF